MQRLFTLRWVCSAALAGLSVFIFPRLTSASVITETFTFTAADFDHTGADAPPESVVDGNFTLTFDPTLDYSQTTEGLTLNLLAPQALSGSGVGFYYDPDSEGGRLLVGGLIGGVGEDDNNTNDFFLVLSQVQTAPTFERLVFTESQHLAGSDSETGTVFASVPEPATTGLLATIGLATVVRRSNRRR